MKKNTTTSILLTLSIVTLVTLILFQMTASSYADVSSPKKQTNAGIDLTDIICKANLVKVYRVNSDKVDCFTPESAQKLVDLGFAQEIPKDRMEAKKS